MQSGCFVPSELINLHTVSCFNKVVVHTILEIYIENDADDSRLINHHGSERKVFDKNMTKAQNGFMLKKLNLGDIAKFFGKSHK